MPSDALVALQTSTTSTATAHSAALILPGGTPRRGLTARFEYSAAANASGSNTVAFTIDVSRDGGTTFNIEFESPPITLSTTSQSGELFVPFSINPSSVANGCQVKASVNISGAGVSPTIAWQADMVPTRP